MRRACRPRTRHARRNRRCCRFLVRSRSCCPRLSAHFFCRRRLVRSLLRPAMCWRGPLGWLWLARPPARRACRPTSPTPRLAPDSWTSRPTAPTHPWSRRASVVRAARRCATPFWWTVESLTNHDTSVSRYSTGAEGCSRRGASAGTVPDVFRLPVTATLSDGNSRGAPGARATSEDARWRPPVLILVPPLLR